MEIAGWVAGWLIKICVGIVMVAVCEALFVAQLLVLFVIRGIPLLLGLSFIGLGVFFGGLAIRTFIETKSVQQAKGPSAFSVAFFVLGFLVLWLIRNFWGGLMTLNI